jgi:acetyltransferase-like isoleucine patch superfamily enzyme
MSTSIGFALRRAYWRTRLGKLGNGTLIYRGVTIHGAKRVAVGSHVSLGDFVHMWGWGGVEIEDDVLLAAFTSIVTLSHDAAACSRGLRYRETLTSAPVRIKSNAWLGTQVVVLPGVTIGRNSIIGAGSVVTTDIPDDVVACGSPAFVRHKLVGHSNKEELISGSLGLGVSRLSRHKKMGQA